MQTFVRRWFSLRFARADHTNWVLSSYWHFEHASVLLKRWTPLFDLDIEKIGIGPAWIRLLGLPLQYWSKYIFQRIGNVIGSYMDYDKSYHHTSMMAYSRILINLDTRGGLEEFITIQWRDTSCKWIIDYEGIPYRYRRCHKVGHIYKDFLLLQKIRDNVQGSETDHPMGNPPPKNSNKSHEERIKDAGESHGTSNKAKVVKGTSDTHPPSPPPQACTAPDQEDISTPGMLLSSSSHIHLVSSISEVIASHSINCTYSPLSTLMASVGSLRTQGLTPPSTLICSLPLPSPASSPCIPSLSYSSLPSHSIPFPSVSPWYSMCSRSKERSFVAFGMDPEATHVTHKNSRGRPSRLTKSRHTTGEEVSLG